MSMLEVTDVDYYYRNKYQTNHVLKKVSCSFDPGKIYAITGRSGSGKTTLLSLIAGLDDPAAGQICLNQVSYKEMSKEKLRREKISIIFQSFNLFPLLTIEENVMYPATLVGKRTREAREKAEVLLEQVGLGAEYRKRYPRMLSGGEQQRVAIARALASGAKIILADEPTGNLDSQNSDKVMSILSGLAKEKDYCVIVVTHDRDISEMADHSYHMKDGRIWGRTSDYEADDKTV